ncbi:MAG: RagB/SusD family nutrient uptake outer membrane protein [Candidatus Cryptobacteroides sp.]
MKKHIFILAMALVPFLLPSCVGDLDTKPLDETIFTDDKAYQDETGYIQGLAKLYSALGLSGQNGAASSEIANTDAGTSAFVRSLWYLQEFTTDECKWAQTGDTGTPELDYNTYGTINNPIISGFYYRVTYTVTLCNDYLKQTSEDKVKARGQESSWPVIRQYRAEARFLRALVYYYGLDVFGNMPFITESDPIGSFLPPQYTRGQLFNFIEGELLDLSDSQDMAEPRTNQYGRADKTAVWLLLSRLYLNAEIYLSTLDDSGNLVSLGTPMYDKSKLYAEKVMDTSYDLCNVYDHLFLADNGSNPESRKEIIFAVRFDGYWTQSYAPYFLVCGSRGPTDNSYKTTSGAWKTNKGNRVTMAFLKNSFWEDIESFMVDGKVVDPVTTPYSGSMPGFAFGHEAETGTLGGQVRQKDRRAIFFTRQCTLPMLENDGATNFTYGWPSYKWSNITSTGTLPSYVDEDGNEITTNDPLQFPSLDYPLMRLGEAYLNYAESCVRLSGGECSDTKAVTALNKLRERAGKSPDLASFDLEYIFKERGRELYWEGFRRTDLIRWNRYAGSDYNWEFKGGIRTGVSIPYFRTLFPIPESDLGVNPKLSQNPGYHVPAE